MNVRIIAIALSLAAASLAALPVQAQNIQLADNAPNRYTVEKGDTLWGIASRFLKDPWRWPEIWRMNRDQIRNPHRIYPGDMIRLDMVGGEPRLSLERRDETLSPRVRSEPLAQEISSIPANAIGPFLTRPLVTDSATLSEAPRIISGEDDRVIIGAGNLAYVDELKEGSPTRWQLYRPGSALRDPATEEVLGYEATYLGEARVRKFGRPATIEIVRAPQEIVRGDRLTPATADQFLAYVPRAPEKPVSGQIISVHNGVAEFGQYAVVTLNRGKRDGLEIGHVLATFRKGDIINPEGRGLPPPDKEAPYREVIKTEASYLANLIITDENGVPKGLVQLPDERHGMAFVFRVFDRVSYALITSAKRPIRLNDVVKNPN